MKKDYPGINNITKPVFDALMGEIKNLNSRYDINTYLTEDNCDFNGDELIIHLPKYLRVSQAYDTKRLVGGILLLTRDSTKGYLYIEMPFSNGTNYEEVVNAFGYGNMNGYIYIYVEEGIDNIKDAIHYVKENIKCVLEDFYIAGVTEL